MFQQRRWQIFETERSRQLELAGIVFLWQAAVGIYFLSLVQQYLPQRLDTSAGFPGYAMACYGVAKFICQPAAGWTADRIGRRTTMVFGMALSMPVLALMMEVRDARSFLVFSALLGMSAATMWPAFIAYVGETTPHGRRAGTMSLLNIAQMAGIGAGTLTGVLMVDFVTYGAAFWVCIAFTFLSLAVVMRRIDDRPTAVVLPVSRDDGARGDPEPEHGPSAAHTLRGGTAWTPGIVMLGVIVLFLTLGTSLHTPMIGAYTRDVLQVKMSYMALLFPLPAIAGAAALWTFGRHADRFGRQVPLIAGLFVASLCIFGLTLTRSPLIVVNLVVLAGLAYAISIPAWGAAALDATDAGSRGLWLGMLSAVQGLGVAGGQALGGLIGGVWGPLAPFKLAALLLMVALALIVAQQAAHTRRRNEVVTVPVRIR